MFKIGLKSNRFLIFISIIQFFFIMSLTFPSSISVAQNGSSENLPPVSNPNLDPAMHPISMTVPVLELVYFTGLESYDPNPEDNLSYHWNFGDGSISKLASPTHTYHQVGEYIISLTVNDTELSDTGKLKIFVMSEGNHNPVAMINIDAEKDNGNYIANISEAINFDASESYDPERFPLSFKWDFGDGSTSSEMITTHEYKENGNFTITLTTFDQEDRKSRDNISIIIGTGEGDGSKKEEDSSEDVMGLSWIILAVVIVIVILLIITWLFLGYLRKRTLLRAEQAAAGRALGGTPKPPTPSFARRDIQQRERLSRLGRIDQLAKSEAQVKQAIMREKLQHERKKVDDDMKKELEDMGIEI